MRRDRRVQHFGEEIADRRSGCRELEPVEEPEGRGLRVVAQGEGHNAAVEATELARGDLVLRMVGKTGITNARDLGMLREMPCDGERAPALAAHAERQSAHAADREPGLVRRQIRAIENGAVAHRAAELLTTADGSDRKSTRLNSSHRTIS